MSNSVMGAVVTGLAAVWVGYLAFVAEEDTVEKYNNTEIVKVLYDRVDSLEASHKVLQEENIRQSVRITKLTIELSKKYESSVILKEYLDNMPFPAWIKVVEMVNSQPLFKMWHVNDEFESAFNISERRYRGKTDYDIWPDELSDKYYESDIEAYESQANLCVVEEVSLHPHDQGGLNVVEDALVCKWPTTVEGKSAIAGQLLRDGEYEHSH